MILTMHIIVAQCINTTYKIIRAGTINWLINNRIGTLVIDVKVGNRQKPAHAQQFPVLLMRQLVDCTGTFALLCKWELR